MDYSKMEMRDAFIQRLFEYAKKDRNIVFVSLDYGAPTLDDFRAELPNQFVNAAISEQNSIGMAAGLALKGKRVYVYSIASFITLRCLEQIKLDLCAMENPVTIAAVGPCYAYSTDGPTHNATEDVALMRSLQGMQVMSPSDASMSADMVELSLKSKHPMYVRMDKGKFMCTSSSRTSLEDGLEVIRPGKDVTLIATGTMVHEALNAADRLSQQGVSAQVVEIYRLKPLNVAKLVGALKGTPRIVTVEEHTINGGLGSILAEVLADNELFIPLKRLAVHDGLLYTKGIRSDLRRDRSIDAAAVVNAVLNWKKSPTVVDRSLYPSDLVNA